MQVVIDTNVAIHLRDGDRDVGDRLPDLPEQICISILSVVELQGGVYRVPSQAEPRAMLLQRMLDNMLVLPFGDSEAAAYGNILAAIGYARPRLMDRMIAAQAIVAGARLITINGKDFADIPNLDLEVWPLPA